MHPKDRVEVRLQPEEDLEAPRQVRRRRVAATFGDPRCWFVVVVVVARLFRRRRRAFGVSRGRRAVVAGRDDDKNDGKNDDDKNAAGARRTKDEENNLCALCSVSFRRARTRGRRRRVNDQRERTCW